MPKGKPTDIQECFRQHLEAQQKMAVCAQEAKRLHDAGDLKGARQALKEAERWRGRMESLSQSIAKAKYQSEG